MLEARGLVVLRGERLVLDGIGFTLGAGGALLLGGPNGVGKSTLLRVLAGLRRPDAGQVMWQSVDALADRTAHGRRVAFLGHTDAVKPGLTAAETLRYATAGPAAPALDAMGLSGLADLPGRMLSAGQRRRLALARVIATAAPLWLLDEPAVGLDAASLDRLGVALAAHRARGGMVVAATHQLIPLPGADTLELRAA